MFTTAPNHPKVEEERYLALLRAANAIATACDCEGASDALVSRLKEVTSFDFLHVVAFDKDTNRPCWSLLEINGKRIDSTAIDELSSEHSPISWVHESGVPAVTEDWTQESRFTTYGSLLAD